MRSAVSHFRLLSCSRGAACVAYADAYGGMASVYLSSAFQHAYMQPSGLVAATGIASQVPFVRGLLDKCAPGSVAIPRTILPNLAHTDDSYRPTTECILPRVALYTCMCLRMCHANFPIDSTSGCFIKSKGMSHCWI